MYTDISIKIQIWYATYLKNTINFKTYTSSVDLSTYFLNDKQLTKHQKICTAGDYGF